MKYLWLAIINGACIVLVIWINFFNQFHLKVWGSLDAITLNRLLETLAISYITSFIFYYLVVRITEKRDQKIVLAFVANRTYFLINQMRFFVSTLRREAGLPYKKTNMNLELYNQDDYPTVKEWGEIAKINPNTWREEEGERINSFMRIPTYLGDINQKVSNVDYNINLIFTMIHLVEPKLITILSEIKDCHFHRDILSKGNFKTDILKTSFDNLQRMVPSIKKYFEAIQELEKYANAKLKKYVDHPHLLVKT